MPKLTLQNLFSQEIFVQIDQNVLQAIQQTGLDWMHACGAKGRCTTCRLVVLKGIEFFGPLSSAEEKFRNEGRLKENERLLCQTTLTGDVIGNVPEQTKFPHIHYSG